MNLYLCRERAGSPHPGNRTDPRHTAVVTTTITETVRVATLGGIRRPRKWPSTVWYDHMIGDLMTLAHRFDFIALRGRSWVLS